MDVIMLRGKKDWNGFKIKKSLLRKDSRVVLPPLTASCNEPFRKTGIAAKIQKL